MVMYDTLQEKHLEAAPPELLNEGAVLDSLARLAGDVVDAGLALLHARDVVLERGLLLPALGAVVAQQVGQLGAVGAVLVDAQLQVLAERLHSVHSMSTLAQQASLARLVRSSWMPSFRFLPDACAVHSVSVTTVIF